ncbi:MAG: FISUMP domain-containing protein [Bacteroidales bacterium]|nr:FISUMP domain-containing protein [Bacteroidales bacterium]
MKKYFGLLPLTLVITLIAFSSCKKDDPADDSQYMEGSMVFALPKYLIAKSPVELEVSGITLPASGITYKWNTTGFGVDSIVGQKVTVTAPAAWGDYSVIVTATHPEYNSAVITKSTTVIDPSSKSSFSGIVKTNDSIIDSRDGTVYYYKTFDKLNWFVSNLKWKGAGKPYQNESALSEVLGMLYSWSEATGGVNRTGLGNGPQGVCPQGWSLPTREDWENFGSAIKGAPLSFDDNWAGIGSKAAVNAMLNGKSMWKYSPDNMKENNSGWNAIPAGSSTNNFNYFTNINMFGFWWSASQKDSTNGEYRFIHFDNSSFPYNFANKANFGASVRCVKLAK